MDMPKVYKVVVELPNGTKVSRTAGGKEGGWSANHELVYKEGMVTDAPEGSLGIFTDKDLKDACRTAEDTSGGKEGTRVIHEAIPLGQELLETNTFFGNNVGRYPAILLGKEVWRGEPAPKKEWVDVTEECCLRWEPGCIDKTKGYYAGRLIHRGTLVGGLGANGIVAQEGFKLETALPLGTAPPLSIWDSFTYFKILKRR